MTPTSKEVCAVQRMTMQSLVYTELTKTETHHSNLLSFFLDMKIFHPTTLTEQPKAVKTQAAAVPSQGPTFELTGSCLGPKTGTGLP